MTTQSRQWNSVPEEQVVWSSAHRRRLRRWRRRHRYRLARGGGGRLWRRHRDLVEDVMLDRLQLGDAIRHLLLAGGELVQALPQRGEIERRLLELLHIGRRGGGHSWRGYGGSALRNGLRCQPAELRG